MKRAKHYSDTDWIRILEEELKPYLEEDLHHASGFAHPNLFIYTNSEPYKPIRAAWGLVPSWVKNTEQKQKLWNNTINARGESIFEKPSFRTSAKSKRCLLCLDGFYEHHHFKGKTYPFFIRRKDKNPMTVAGLWEEWLDKETGELVTTFTVVTTKANEMMAKIHNSPKISEPRMPLILEEKMANDWLTIIENEDDKKKINSLIQPQSNIEFEAYTVKALRAKNATGNIPEVSEEFIYGELEDIFES
ncbi:MAG: SOS response-associated peptidase [Bacteroidales bacterium]|nr:SOS response-associated peptidase [Bacteroidales bacterium]